MPAFAGMTGGYRTPIYVELYLGNYHTRALSRRGILELHAITAWRLLPSYLRRMSGIDGSLTKQEHIAPQFDSVEREIRGPVGFSNQER
jgi:hypothetical protein